MRLKLRNVLEIIGISFLGLAFMLLVLIIAEIYNLIEIYPLENLELLESITDNGFDEFINRNTFHIYVLILIAIFYIPILFTTILAMFCLKSRFKENQVK